MSEVRDSRMVTLSLQRLRVSMEATVGVSTSAVSILDGDGERIRDTLDTHEHHLSGALQTTSSRLRRVQLTARGERLLVFSSVLFFTISFVSILANRLGLINLATSATQSIFWTSGVSEGIHAVIAPKEESCPREEDVVWGTIR